MSIILIAAIVFVFAVPAIAHYKKWISGHAAASIAFGAGIVVALCAVAAFFVTNQQPSTTPSNFVAGTTRMGGVASVKSPTIATAEPQTTAVTEKERAKAPSQQVVVESNSTEVLFDGQLRISMFTANYEGKPMYLKFYGQIAGPGLKPLKINAAGPGFSVKYGGYEITLLEVNVLDARVMAVESNDTSTN